MTRGVGAGHARRAVGRNPVRHVLLLVAVAIGMGGCAAMVQMASPSADEMAALDAAANVDDLFPVDP